MGRPNRPRRQHLVPKSYMRLFAGGEIVSVRRRDGKAYPSHVRAVTVRNDFYSFTDHMDSVSPRLEHWFDKVVESRGVPALRKCAEGREVTDEDLYDLVVFIAAQLVRTATVGDLLTQIDAHLLPALVYQEYISRHGIEHGGLTPAQQQEYQYLVSNVDRRRVVGRESQIRTILRELVSLIARLSDWHWYVLESDSPCLIIGDAPVVTIQPPIGWHGLLPVGSPVLLPLTPTKLLVGEQEPPLRLASLSSEFASVVNQRICDEANDLIINAPDLPWPSGITLLPRRPPLPAPTFTFSQSPEGSRPTPAVFPSGQESIESLLELLERRTAGPLPL